MFDGFSTDLLDVGDGVRILTRTSGTGPPLLLLHGFPQTHVCWHKIASRLAEQFTIVVTDLRGYGASSKPEGAPDHAAYSKRSMALDQVKVMRSLGFEQFFVAGHDRGGRVAHRLALDHPRSVQRIAFLDIAPTETMYAATDRNFAEAYYHWYFLIQPFDLPERLIAAEAEFYLRKTLESWTKRAGAISEKAMAEYVAAFKQPSAIHAACEDYRASATIDLDHDRTSDAEARRLSVDALVLWGGRGVVAKQFDVIACWQKKSDAAVDGRALDCGHFLPEEAPDETLKELSRFFASDQRTR